MTVVATLATAPLTALHFGRLSLVSLPANVLAAPAVAPVMWLGTWPARWASRPALAAPVATAALPLAYLTWLAERAAAVPSPSRRRRRPRGGVAAYAAAAAPAWRAAAARRRRLGATRHAGAAAGPRRAPRSRPGDPGAGLPRARAAAADLTISFLDVGQGDATLIQHGGRRGARRHRPARRTDPGACARRACAASTSSCSPTTRPTTTAPPRRCSTRCRSEVLDGGGSGGSPPAGGRHAAAARRAPQRPRRPALGAPPPAPRARVASDAGQVLRAGPIELRVLWPRRDPAAPPGADPNVRATVVLVRDGASTCCSPPTPSRGPLPARLPSSMR